MQTRAAHFSFHSTIGTYAMALLFIISISGVATLYSHQLSVWSLPALWQATQQERAFGDELEEVWPKITEVAGGISPSSEIVIVMPDGAGPVLFETEGTPEHVRGWINGSDLGLLAHEDLGHFVDVFHMALHLPGLWGFSLVGMIGVLLCVMLITGILINTKPLKAMITRPRLTAKHGFRDIHNLIGLWILPVHWIYCFSAATAGLLITVSIPLASIVHDGDFTPLFSDLFGTAPTYNYTAGATPNFSAALETLEREWPAFQPELIEVKNAGAETMHFLMLGSVDRSFTVSNNVMMNAFDGSIIEINSSTETWIRTVYSAMLQAHFQNGAGPLSRGIFTLLGLTLAFMPLSGVIIWAKRSGAANPKTEAQILREKNYRLLFGLCIGAMIGFCVIALFVRFWPNNYTLGLGAFLASWALIAGVNRLSSRSFNAAISTWLTIAGAAFALLPLSTLLISTTDVVSVWTVQDHAIFWVDLCFCVIAIGLFYCARTIRSSASETLSPRSAQTSA